MIPAVSPQQELTPSVPIVASVQSAPSNVQSAPSNVRHVQDAPARHVQNVENVQNPHIGHVQNVQASPPRTAPTVPRVRRAVNTERLLIRGTAKILEYEDLLDTVRYVGCLAFFEGQIGLSFKGLELPTDFELRGSSTVYECQPGTFQPLSMSPAYSQGVHLALTVWEAWQRLIEVESDPASGMEEIEATRSALNREYDEFTMRCGFLHDNQHLLKFDGATDDRLGLLLALEREECGVVHKADCFSERTWFPTQEVFGQIYFEESLEDRLTNAYARVRNECGLIDLDRISELTGIAAEEADDLLVEMGLAMREPILLRGSGHRGSVGEDTIVDS